MIVVLMALLSLSAIYFTRLLQRRNMKVAAASVACLYIYLIIWIYAVFIMDVADLGFAEKETRITLLHGSDIYHSFVRLNVMMDKIPLPLLEAIAAVAALTFIACLIVVFHGFFEISCEIIRFVKQKEYYVFCNKIKQVVRSVALHRNKKTIRQLYCRANC